MQSKSQVKIPKFKPKSLLRKVARVVIDHFKYRQAIKEYLAEEKHFLESGGNVRFPQYSHHPYLNDRNASLPVEPHYFYHPAWACRVLKEISPKNHTDISSIFSFAGNVSAFFPTTYYEYQPPQVQLDGLTTDRIDLCALKFPDNSIESLSCMHVVEHIGLGRYGDPLNPDGDLIAALELTRVLARDGHLLFVVPMGEQPRLEFNAHRVYSYPQVIAMFPGLEVLEFACIAKGGLTRHSNSDSLKGELYACGCFHFYKPAG